jgi:hypothetical protein
MIGGLDLIGARSRFGLGPLLSRAYRHLHPCHALGRQLPVAAYQSQRLSVRRLSLGPFGVQRLSAPPLRSSQGQKMIDS